MNRALISVAAVTVALSSSAALAHARLQSATPGPSTVVRSAPAELRLRFNEPVIARFTTVAIVGPNNRALHVDTPTVDARDPRTVVARVHGAAVAGVYRVNWAAATGDMHRMTGSYTFTVRP